MQESPREGRIKSIEELKAAYPDGMMIYYQPDVTHHEQLTRALSSALPGFLVAVTNKIMFSYPQDCGYQLGDKFYNIGAGRSYCYVLLHGLTDLPPKQIYQVIPPDERPPLEGGMLIPVPATRVIAYTCYEPKDILEEKEIIKKHDRKPLPLEMTYHGLRKFVTERNMGKNEEWIYQLDLLFDKAWTSHIDPVITGFGAANSKSENIKWYVDALLLEYLRKHNSLDKPLQDARPFPHELALQGGLNIEYVYNGTRWVAFVPSRRVIGPISDDLQNSGYEVVELGEEEVNHKAGVKCRSLVTRWRK